MQKHPAIINKLDNIHIIILKAFFLISVILFCILYIISPIAKSIVPTNNHIDCNSISPLYKPITNGYIVIAISAII